jgi:small neutral amino acid transporter SnatA (MarC family)
MSEPRQERALFSAGARAVLLISRAAIISGLNTLDLFRIDASDVRMSGALNVWLQSYEKHTKNNACKKYTQKKQLTKILLALARCDL